MKTNILVALSILCSISSYSQPGSLDLTFSGDGKVTTSIGPSVDAGNAIAVQSDGKIVVAGETFNGTNYDFAVVRYNIDGTIDPSFGGSGIVITDFGVGVAMASSVVIQSDGKIIAGGRSSDANNSNMDFTLARYNTDGSLDITFDGDGKVRTNLNGGIISNLALQNDGKLLAIGGGGGNNTALVRYNLDGSLDNTFNGNGIVLTPNSGRNAIVIQNDGKIVAAGGRYNGSTTDFAISRFNTNGTLDATFGISGTVITPSTGTANSVALQSDGKIVVGGQSNNTGMYYDMILARYNTDGTLDPTFDGDGKLNTTFGEIHALAYAVAIQNDGKIIAAGFSGHYINGFGTFYDFALARYNSDGSLDITFDGDGKVTTDMHGGGGDDRGYAMKLFEFKIYVAGTNTSDFAVARYNNDATALPLNLISFSGFPDKSGIQLNWKTAAEKNTAYFSIERSTDGRNFSEIGRLNILSSTSNEKNYSFNDLQPFSGNNFYRLKIIDNDGLFAYSKIIRLNITREAEFFQLYPNPVKDILLVSVEGVGTANYTITDAGGRKVKQETILLKGIGFSIDVHSLPRGKYYLTIQQARHSGSESFQKL